MNDNLIIAILDTNFEVVEYINKYKTFIWTDRYSSHGDCLLELPAHLIYSQYIREGNYIWINKSDRLMIIDYLEISNSLDDENLLIINARSLESILDRRVIWTQLNFMGNFQEGIKKIITDNIINPSITNRKIPNFIFIDSTDANITELTMDVQYLGENILDIITDLCTENNVGWKIIFNEQTRNFEFSLYHGVDRSWNQETNPYVVFSFSNRNLINSEYIESSKTYKTDILVGGEGEGASKTMVSNTNQDPVVTGLARREMYSEAGNLSSNIDEGELTPAEYTALLKQFGLYELYDNRYIQMFSGEAESTKKYLFGRDYFMGDIVQIEDRYGNTGSSRIDEMIYSVDSNGFVYYPTFITIE